MLELLCKISFFLCMLVMYTYVTSAREVVITIFGYILCVFSYYYFRAIKTAIDELLNYVHNYGVSKTNLGSSHASSYAVNKKYNKVTNAVNVPSMNNGVFGPVCRTKNVLSRNPPAVFNCKFNNFTMNGDMTSPIMKNRLSVENGGKCMEKMKLPMLSMKQGFNLSTPLRFRNNSPPARNPFSSPKKCTNNLDMETYLNVKSPGFTGRIVDKALESASYHIKYPAVKQIPAYRFDKSALSHLSKIPRMNSTPVVRIAPPEPISIHLLNNIEKNKDPSFIQAMKDFSRKRNYSQEETEMSTATVKKSRKNDIKKFTISQYKRTLEDKSRDVLEDKNKKRCDNHTRDATRMVVYAPSVVSVSNNNLNTYSKKRKSSKTDKIINECTGSIEKCRKIDESPKGIHTVEYSNETKLQDCHLKSSNPLPSEQSTLVESSDQLMKQSRNELFDDENFEYVRVASGKILNRTNCLYRRKLNSNRIDPVSVIASEPEIVGEFGGSDDVSMKKHLLQNLLNNIEKKDRKDEKVIFYENSIIEEVAKRNSESEEPLQQVPNSVYTDSFERNEERIDINDISTNELEESAVNTLHFPNNESYAMSGLSHSIPIASDLYNSYSENSIEDLHVKNGLNFTDSGYDTSSTENSINNSSRIKEANTPTSMHVGEYACEDIDFSNATANIPFERISSPAKTTFLNDVCNNFKSNSANENWFKTFSTPAGTSFPASSNGFGATTHQSPAVSNSELKCNGLFKNASTALFESGEKKFFNPLNTQVNASSNNNLDMNTNSSNVFGSKYEEVSMQFEPSFSSFSALSSASNTSLASNDIGTESVKNFSAFGGGDNGVTPSLPKQIQSPNPFVIQHNIGNAAIGGFSIGSGGNSRNRVTHSRRNK